MVNNRLKAVILLAFSIVILVLFLGAISLSGSSTTLLDFFRSLGVQFGFIIVVIVGYSTSLLADKLLGFGEKKGLHIIFGLLIGIGYVILTRVLPGLSIATPMLPGAVSQSLNWLVVAIFAPIVETLFFLGIVMGFLQEIGLSKIQSVVGQAILFSFFHLGAYLVGIFNFSSTEVIMGLSANISVFISAFLFAILAGFLVNLKQFKGLLVAIVIHIVINVSVLTNLAITVIGGN